MFFPDGEFYSISVGKMYTIVGGSNEEAVLYRNSDKSVLALVDNLEESVLFCKILQESEKECMFIVVSVDGMICLMTNNNSIQILERKQQLSFATIKNNLLYIGTEKGDLDIFSLELEHLAAYVTDSPILDVEQIKDNVHILCDNGVHTGDKYGNILYSLYFDNPSAFKCLDGNVIAFCVGNKFYLYKEKKKLFEASAEESIETICFVDNSFILGGNFEGFLCINVNNYALFKLEANAFNCQNIQVLDKYLISFVHNQNTIGILDIRDKNSLKLYEIKVEIVFDYSININANKQHLIGVAGLGGYEFIDTN